MHFYWWYYYSCWLQWIQSNASLKNTEQVSTCIEWYVLLNVSIIKLRHVYYSTIAIVCERITLHCHSRRPLIRFSFNGYAVEFTLFDFDFRLDVGLVFHESRKAITSSMVCFCGFAHSLLLLLSLTWSNKFIVPLQHLCSQCCVMLFNKTK